MYKGYWKSISAVALSTFYEDSALHEVGKIRMAEWWRAQKDVTVPLRTGVALTFWYSLDGSHVLPDAIKVGLKSTLTAEFEAVFCLTYQSFTNMPSHVRTINCETLLSYSVFSQVLCNGSALVGDGFIGVIAEWIKLVGAAELDVIREFEAVTICDPDSLWQSRAIPPVIAFGHASATLQVEEVSGEDEDKVTQLKHLTYEHCNRPRDFKKMTTPLRWPRGSPALLSLVRRIKPMVSSFGDWRGGHDVESVMNTVWDTYNNWGLRQAFNDPMTYSAVPW